MVIVGERVVGKVGVLFVVGVVYVVGVFDVVVDDVGADHAFESVYS